jgi:hypothetical protein
MMLVKVDKCAHCEQTLDKCICNEVDAFFKDVKDIKK